MTDNKDFVMVPREATALLPCPFCGSDSVSVYPRTCDKKTPYNPLDRAFPMVRCGKCYAEVPGENWKGEDTAIESWNRRALLQAAPAAEVTWRPIESAPKDGTQVLAYREDWGIFMAMYCSADALASMSDKEREELDEESLFQMDWWGSDADGDGLSLLADAIANYERATVGVEGKRNG